MNILIVDDQIYVVAGIEKEVRWEKLDIQEVFTAYSAQEAKAVFGQHRIDIMLCDIEMPGENGLNLFAWVNEQGFDTACIFLTAHADFGYAQTALRLGSFDYILQPARYEEIEESILRVKEQICEKRKDRNLYDHRVQVYEECCRMQEGRGQETVDKIKEYIHYHLDQDIRREDIAAYVYMNPSYVSRMFKKAEGIALKDYIIQEKMSFARELLKNLELPVSLIALKTGYSNFSHFSQVYKKVYGISPTEERRRE